MLVTSEQSHFMKKMGYQVEGRLARVMQIDGEFVDGIMMSLLID